MKYIVDYTTKFKKEYNKMKRQGKDLNKLHEVINTLSSGEKLDVKYKDHELKDNKQYKNCRECHIEPDWLLVYRIVDNELLLVLARTGSHSELFGK